MTDLTPDAVDDDPKPKRRKSLTNGTCAECGHGFMYEPAKGKPAPDLCGQMACAAERWDPVSWEGRARMASARQKARKHLDDLDRRALAAHPSPVMVGHGWQRNPQQAD